MYISLLVFLKPKLSAQKNATIFAFKHFHFLSRLRPPPDPTPATQDQPDGARFAFLCSIVMLARLL
jgi:hypothetical protein